MLRVFTSNKPEALAALLQGHLEAEVGLPPRDPFAEVQLLVASRPLGDWLTRELAARAGIVAGLRPWLVQRFVAELCARAFPRRTLVDRAFVRDRLVARFVTGAGADPSLAPVHRYFEGASGRSLELRRLQLANELGRLFEEYLYSRRELLDAWGARRATAVEHRDAVASWQAALWRELTAGEACVAPSELLGVEPARLLSGAAPLFVFGLASVGTFVHELLAHLARATEVSLYALTPCPEPWEAEGPRGGGGASGAGGASVASGALDGDDPFALRADPCRLLGLWGRPTRERVRLLDGLSGGAVSGAFVDPARHDATLLRRLQSDLLRREATRPAATAASADSSLLVLRAPNRRRECEAVAARIWRLLEERGEAGDPLRLDDVSVAIASADVESVLVPLLAALHEHDELPWQLVGLPSALTSPVVEAAQLLLELPLSRFTRAELLRVLTHPVVMARFPEASASDWSRWIDAVGIVHGASHVDHSGTSIDRDVLNWDQGLRRIALGAFLETSGADGGTGDAAEGAFAFGAERYLASPAGTHLDEGAGALLLLARSLLADAQALRQVSRSAAQWAPVFERLLEAYLTPRDDGERRALEACLRAARGLATRPLSHAPLPYALASALLRDELSAAAATGGNAVTGGVRVSSLHASRGLPARVSFVVGLDEGSFPGGAPDSALDLRPKHPRAGDASPRERDEAVFLEALLATRDALVLSYVARDERTGEARSPSPVVAELLRAVDERFLHRAPSPSGPHPLAVDVPLWRADEGPETDAVLASCDAGRAERALRATGLALAARRRAPGCTPAGSSSEGPGATKGATTARELLDELPPGRRRALGAALRLHTAELQEAELRAVEPLEAPTPPRSSSKSAAAPLGRGERTPRVTLGQLRGYLECPLQGAAAVRLGLRTDDDDELERAERRDEVFLASALTATSLLRETFLAVGRGARGAAPSHDDAAWARAYDARALVRIARGDFPVGVFYEAERRHGLAALTGWRDGVVALASSTDFHLQVVRLGPAREGEAAERVAPALRLALHRAGTAPGEAGSPSGAGVGSGSGSDFGSGAGLDAGPGAGCGPGVPTPSSVGWVELVGASQPLLGDEWSLVLLRSEPPRERGPQLRRLLRPWIDHLALTAAELRPAGPLRVAFVGPSGSATARRFRLDALTPAAARAHLEALAASLFLGDNELLAPLEALVRRFVERKHESFADAVEHVMQSAAGGFSGPCEGPVRRPERYRVPGEAEAERLFVERLEPLVARLHADDDGEAEEGAP